MSGWNALSEPDWLDDGATGDDGAMGDDGATALLNLTTEPVGTNCATGGQLVEAGLDNGDADGVAGNGVLEEGEVDESDFVCNGAGAIGVPNPSFEDPVFTSGVVPATGWTANNGEGSGGVDRVSFSDVEFGDQYHWLNLTGFGGPETGFTESNAGLIGDATVGTYTVTVSLGHRTNDATTDGSIIVELLADGTVIGTRTLNDPNAAIPIDTFMDFGTEAVVLAGDAAIGGDLTIRVSATNGTGNPRSQAQIDNVRLDYRP